MYRFTTFITVLGLISALTVLPLRAFAHGEVDEAQLAEFHEHVDDYAREIRMLTDELDPIVDAYASGEDVAPELEDLIHEWEEVGVHAAIETRAPVTYPGIWQALVALQQAAGAGKPAEAVAAAAEDVEAALWQGMGGVRLAASQVGAATTSEPAMAPASGPETIDQILADLEQAVAAYQADDVKRAESLIHQTYMNRFEGLEGDLIAQDPDLVSSLEKDFNATLPLLMQGGASMEEVRAQLENMRAQLDQANHLLEKAEQSRSEVF